MELYDISIGARVKHPTMGVGVVYEMDARIVHVFFKEHGEQPISRSFEGLVTIAPGVEIGQEPLDLEHVKDSLREVLEEMQQPQRPVEMARKYEGGMLEMRPKDPSLKSKEVPIDDFFHKVVMIPFGPWPFVNAKPIQANCSSEPTISIRDRTLGGVRRASALLR
ncbi:MAG: hypothetical protein IPH53_09110 [Flavobacteriales bacterium]|nr:hypothetical protein [Flavobacteriales bacterium]